MQFTCRPGVFPGHHDHTLHSVDNRPLPHNDESVEQTLPWGPLTETQVAAQQICVIVLVLYNNFEFPCMHTATV